MCLRIAFDLDGTISAAPEMFEKLMAVLMKAEQEVVVLTGALHSFPDSARTVEGRTTQLANLGLVQHIHYDSVHVCVGQDGHEVASSKAAWCAENRIDLLIDDEPMYCAAVEQITNVAQFRKKT